MSHAAEIIEVANRFGADLEYTRAGGGNCSYKQDGVLYIKPSGVSMASLTEADLVPLKLDVLMDALYSDKPVDGDPVRVAAQAAQLGNYERRPSVEILFHALMPETLVFHTHPLVANALTCNADAEELTEKLFGDKAVYVPYTDPGVPLAREVDARRKAFTARTGLAAPPITFLGNHGFIVAGETGAEVSERVEWLTAVIQGAIDSAPAAASEGDAQNVDDLILALAPTLRGLLGDTALPIVTSDSSAFVQANATADNAIVAQGPLIPDQIVYAGSLPLVVEDSDPEKAKQALGAYKEANGVNPNVVVVPGKVVFGVGASLAAAQTALGTFTDSLRVARDANAIGSVRTLTAEQRHFIEHWESESYRKKINASAHTGRLDGKVVLITGAAQGFGLGITEEVISEGATVVLADLNFELAEANAERLAGQHGQGRALAVKVNVSDEESQAEAITQVVKALGGVDVFISNAGIARAGSVYEQTAQIFDLVTSVNYKGYFLGVKAVAPIMRAQHRANPGVWLDIIEINSKSGLEGSKRNFAYSGSKFGGIGLTQSFALELVEDGIKVNAICPGNYLDGPLWSDPERGLFVQYLNAGKVPGAKTVQDVRDYYESKVPIGRGCLPSDLAKAVYYIVDQAYETGQAVPVTGGQNMLN
ncbi:MAG: SDR family NAD(P)-dependent oxidoreductase [Propionibacteriaceae bacterium]|jgi:rhamnose utilization protein RhaD (predicted bifunctional aldolase and dehydrogenase)/NAD(P)-dependent dehydrogenase (short-subunit alcohol dehydrogenase family)|nr:SDR family NAD(P)-dependent oxidoreductase [Propionibacteriaceae bacterium]